MIGATIKLIEDIASFKKGYTDEMNLKKEANMKVFNNINKYLTWFNETLSKFDFTLTTLISQEQISSMVSSVE